MARQRKYPQAPGSHNYEFPYDYWAFKEWCVNTQGLSESSADVYISNIRTAFTAVYDDKDPLFINLRNAFISQNYHAPQRRIARLEDKYETLKAYTETLEECGDVWLDSYNSRLPFNQEKLAPKDMWVRAFQAYCRYIRWKIDKERLFYGMRIKTVDDPVTFLEVPMSKQFHQYLMNKGKGYDKKSRYTYYSKLKRLYNLFFRRILKRSVFEEFVFRKFSSEAVDAFLDLLSKKIDEQLVTPHFMDLSDDDLRRGKTAFCQYRYFLDDYLKNPQKYYIEEYVLPNP